MHVASDSSLVVPLERVTFAVVDVETTGLDPSLGHRICEIAIVRGTLDGDVSTFRQYVNPERPVDPGARAVHRIPDEVLWRAPRFEEIAPVVRDWLDASVIVGHNASFDPSFLAAEWRRLRWPPPPVYVIDTLTLARRWLRLPRYSLDAVARALRVFRRDAHRALGDAQTTWEVLRSLLRLLGIHSNATLADLMKAQGRPMHWPSVAWDHLPPPLQEALRSGRRLWLRYLSPYQGLTERWVQPLDVSNGYLIAYCHLRGAQRTFRLDRILDMRLDDRDPSS